MTSYLGGAALDPGQSPVTGVLLSNLGTPDAPTPTAVRQYLREFLSDPRVVELPRWLWWLILHGFILRFRPQRSAAAYAEVWTAQGAPLRSISQRQLQGLQRALNEAGAGAVKLALGMRYGNPSLSDALYALRDQGVDRLLVLPLYPQYSATTTASTIDAVSLELRRWRRIPALRTVTSYYADSDYLDALQESVESHWQVHGQAERLLFSFHGIPQRYVEAGDPYAQQCRYTAEHVARELKLAGNQWQVVFQSRLGRSPWLQPYTDDALTTLAAQGVKSVDIICPGFSADCLETLEEINIRYRRVFLAAGGEKFHYIKALNDSDTHMDMLASLIKRNLQGWG